jgi:Na+/pantothenate symporter
MTWIGTGFVAVYVPIYHILKQRNPKSIKTLLDIHNFGFLIAFLLISIHFAGQLSRPTIPDLGEGIALYVTMVLLVGTGMWQRFAPRSTKPRTWYTLRTNRVVHVSLISSFYIIVTVHAATNLA